MNTTTTPTRSTARSQAVAGIADRIASQQTQ